MTIANRLNELIAEKRIQKKQLAERIGVAASTLNTWLSRGEDFPAQYVIPICGVLGISAEKLLEGRDVPLPVILMTMFKSQQKSGSCLIRSATSTAKA